MPTVPILNNNIQTNISGLNRVSTQYDSGADAIGKVFNQASQIMQQAKTDADRIKVQEADELLTQWEIKKLHDPKDGALYKKGEQAFELPEAVNKDFDAQTEEIQKGLTSEAQRFYFEKLKSERKNSINKTIDHHVGVQMREYGAAKTDSYIKSQRDYAILNANDPKKVEEAINKQLSSYLIQAQIDGSDAETIKNKSAEITGLTHASVVSRMISQDNDVDAEKYFEKNKDKFGKFLPDIEKEVEAASLRGKSQKLADQVWGKSKNYSTAMNALKDPNIDPKLRDATENRINDLYRQYKIQESEREKNFNIMSANIIDKHGTTDKIPRSMWNSYTSSERSALEAYARSKQKGESGEARSNDPYVFDDLSTLKAVAPDKFLAIDLTNPKYLNSLKPSTRESFVKEQAEMRSGKRVDGLMTEAKIVNDSIKSIGIKEDSDDGITFRRMADEKAEEFSRLNGKRPSNDELRKITDQLSVEVITDKGILFDSKKKLFQIKAEDKIEGFNLNDKDKKEVENFLKKKGVPITDKNVTEFYKQVLTKKGLLNGK